MLPQPEQADKRAAVLHVDDLGYSFLLVGSGIGAVAAAFYLAYARDRRHSGRFIVGAAMAEMLAILVFAFSTSYAASFLLLVVVGGAAVLTQSLTNTKIQLSAPNDIRGRVMGIHGGLGKVGEAGPQSIISINRGSRDGIEVGHVLALYALGGSVRDVSKPREARDAMIKLPDERAGLAFVFRVFNRVSYALVMHITRPIGPLDVVQAP